MNTWADLREIRRQGMRPSLPVVVTTDGQRPTWLLAEEGCLVIRHNAGETFHVELLDGLRVWLFIGNCDRASAVVSLMGAKGIRPSELGSWCPCMGRMDFQPVHCEVAKSWQ
jgi:hypothetical protein